MTINQSGIIVNWRGGGLSIEFDEEVSEDNAK